MVVDDQETRVGTLPSIATIGDGGGLGCSELDNNPLLLTILRPRVVS